MQYPERGSLRLASLFLLFIPVFLLLSCSSDDSTTPDSGSVQADVDQYMLTLPGWEIFSPALPAKDIELADEEETLDQVEGSPYLCSTTHCSIQDTPEEIITHGTDEGVLWLGALIQGASYRGGVGTMRPLSITQRGPITIGIDVLSSDSKRTVTNPTSTNVRLAIGELIDSAMASGHAGGGGIIYHETNYHSLDQAMIDMKVSAKFIGGSARARMEASQSTDTRTVMAYFKQVMFKTYMDLPQTPSDMFSNSFTAEVMQEQIKLGNIGDTNLPVFVSEITWGRMMMLTMTSTSTVDSMKAALKAKKDGVGSATIAAELQQVIDQSEIKVAALGGTDASVLALIKTGDLGEFFNDTAPLDSAVPLAFKLRNLANPTILATVGETTEYNREECSAVDAQFYDNETDFRNAISGQGGNHDSFLTTEASVTEAVDGITLTLTGDNKPLGKSLLFKGSNTGLPFDFTLEAEHEHPTQPEYSLVWEDEESGEGAHNNTISIGDRDDQENDDFYLRAAALEENCHIMAIGLYIVENNDNDDESLEVWGGSEGDIWLGSYPSEVDDAIPSGSGDSFLGVVSRVPVTHIYFNEDPGDDDIFVKDFHFGVRCEDTKSPD